MARENVLVDAQWLSENLDKPNLVIVEVDEDTEAYDQNHIRNAIKLNWKTELQDPVRREFIDKSGFEKLMSEKGISNEDLVVLYGGNNNWFATYAYWYFKLYGHKDVRILDGGRKKWELDSRNLVSEVPLRPKTNYVAKEQDLELRAFRDDVLEAIGKQNLVDVRSPDEYAGRLLAPAHLPQEGGRIGGHIPTAVNVPWSRAANDDGTFKSNDELRKIYADAGVDFEKETIAYCRIGERSAFSWFVLKELLDVSKVRNYDGSWTEYGSLVGVPVAVGDEPGAA
jgi:thiosulfate/3-mercaptopyruvate sulfurtransferase